jgi:citrate lyase gamma subunit
LENEIAEAYDSEPMQARGLIRPMDWIEFELGFISGYPFKGDIELWDKWRRWLEDQDSNVVREILDDPEVTGFVRGSSGITMAVDITFERGRKEDIEYVKSRYEKLRASQDPCGRVAADALHDALSDWSDGNEGLNASSGYRNVRRRKPSAEIYARLADVMFRKKKEMDEVEETLIRQVSEEYGNRSQAAMRSDLVVIGVADSVSVGDEDTYGVADCAIRASVSKVLRGEAGQRQIAFNAHIQEGERQQEPEEGQRYIFFLNAAPNQSYSFMKFMRATDLNVAEVVKLIEEWSAFSNGSSSSPATETSPATR